ncbi:MAG: hypothetical protein HY291_22695 [Planctomycetes bacterium]|nr:hypothetical protein [Planctomycetota bacterium]
MRVFRLSVPMALVFILMPAGVKATDAPPVKSACERAGYWLIEQHNLDEGTFGKTRLGKEPGVVGLVLKALGEGPRDYREAHGPFITKPVKYLLAHQKENGAITLDGRDTYNTALALLGLQVQHNTAYRVEIQSAKDYLAKCQAKDGGFTYGEGFRQGGDLSNTLFGLSGIKTGGGKVDKDLFTNALDFIRRCQDNPETNPEMAAKQGPGTGGAYYQPNKSEAGTVQIKRGEGQALDLPKPYGSMTAAAIECYLLCGLKADAPEVQAALKWFKKNFSAKENPGAGMQGYYYYAFAVSRALSSAGIKEIDMGEGQKVNWASALADQLLSVQNRGTPEEGGRAMRGSFVNKEPRWMEDDPVLCTAYALATLNICYENLSGKEE